MSQSANVRSVEAIHDFKIALANFAEDARNALSGTEMDLRRARNWLQRDQLTYWQTQVKRCNEQVSTARTELHRRKLSQQGSDAVSDTEQKENLRAAQRKLEEAERKVALVKRWIPILEHAISEYHSAAQPLGDRLTGALVASMALLDRTVASVEAYLAVAPPVTPVAPEPAAAAREAVGSSATSSAAPAPTPAPPNGDGASPAAGAATEPPATPVPAAPPVPVEGDPRP